VTHLALLMRRGIGVGRSSSGSGVHHDDVMIIQRRGSRDLHGEVRHSSSRGAGERRKEDIRRT